MFGLTVNEGQGTLVNSRKQCLHQNYSQVAPQALCSTHVARAPPPPSHHHEARATTSHTRTTLMFSCLVLSHGSRPGCENSRAQFPEQIRHTDGAAAGVSDDVGVGMGWNGRGGSEVVGMAVE